MRGELEVALDRRRMMEALRGGERSAGEIERRVGVNQPTASKHLRALRQAGLPKAF